MLGLANVRNSQVVVLLLNAQHVLLLLELNVGLDKCTPRISEVLKSTVAMHSPADQLEEVGSKV
jgi:hypothetical protein